MYNSQGSTVYIILYKRALQGAANIVSGLTPSHLVVVADHDDPLEPAEAVLGVLQHEGNERLDLQDLGGLLHQHVVVLGDTHTHTAHRSAHNSSLEGAMEL